MRKRHPQPELAGEDRMLWEKIARTVTPLGARARFAAAGEIDREAFEAALTPVAPPHAAAVPAPAADPAPRPSAAPAPPPPPARASKAGAIEPGTARRIAKGRLVIEARIDLHGLTQDEAHGLLLVFIERAARRHLRTVLVITGKGGAPRAEGVLKRAVPLWLAQPAFSRFVSGHAEAARAHGGAGALYVRLRGA